MTLPDRAMQALGWLVTVHYGSASLLETIWTIAAVLGLLTTAWLWRQALLDQDALHEAADFVPGGPRDIIAQGNARNNLYKMAVEAFLVVVGVSAMLTPAARAIPSAYGIILALGSTAIALLLTIAALQDHRDRREFLAVVRRIAGDNARRDRRASDQPKEERQP